MKPTTRLRILSHFRKHQTASVRELSQFMEMTGANIRHHLAVLEANDLIEVISLRKEGRGRPMQVYGLSRRVIGDGLDNLAGSLLDVLLEGASRDDQKTRLMSVGSHLAGVNEDNIPIMKRLLRTVENLNDLHYQAHWEAGVIGPRLILGHCPYAAIITKHPELCQMDALILSANIGSPVEQKAKLQLNDKSLPYCAFVISQ
jgi:predicted ArsR family transcriptional regulator